HPPQPTHFPYTTLFRSHRKPNPTEPRNPAVAYLPFGLDLTTLSPIRGSESPATGTRRRVLVPSSPLHLTLTLPLASPEGRYELKDRKSTRLNSSHQIIS